MTQRILLQTSITYDENNWHIGRFSLLAEHLRSRRDGAGDYYEVTLRDRQPGGGGDDPLLVDLSPQTFDQVWIFGVDGGRISGLNASETSGLAKFYEAGGSIMLTRDHEDMGCALSRVSDVGAVHCWQHVAPEDDEKRRRNDDNNPDIGWPNYHSGPNGAFQEIEVLDATHPLVRDVRYLPAHPHEGVLRSPDSQAGRAIVQGRSLRSQNAFLSVVAFDHKRSEKSPPRRGVAQSSFHHFADYNLDISKGAPSFVSDAVASEDLRSPEGQEHTRRYWSNLASWLAYET